MGEGPQGPARNALEGALARGDGRHTHMHTPCTQAQKDSTVYKMCVTSQFKLLIRSASKGSSAQGRDETKGKPGTGLAQTVWGEGPFRADIGRAPGKAVPCREEPRCSSVLIPVPSATGTRLCRRQALSCTHPAPPPRLPCAESQGEHGAPSYRGEEEGEEAAGGRGQGPRRPDKLPRVLTETG